MVQCASVHCWGHSTVQYPGSTNQEFVCPVAKPRQSHALRNSILKYFTDDDVMTYGSTSFNLVPGSALDGDLGPMGSCGMRSSFVSFHYHRRTTCALRFSRAEWNCASRSRGVEAGPLRPLPTPRNNWEPLKKKSRSNPIFPDFSRAGFQTFSSADLGYTSVHTSSEYSILEGYSVLRYSSSVPVEITSLWKAEEGQQALAVFLTHFGDLGSWELAQRLAPLIPEFRVRGVAVVLVGLGSPQAAALFSSSTEVPPSFLYADPEGTVYRSLGFSKGFGEDLEISPYLKLLPMLMGIGSPGTIQEVLRGYVGDRSAKQVFREQTAFDILGRGYQRPFELATQRLSNMISILSKWAELAPKREELLTQQGGVLIFRGKEVVFRHNDSGILKTADVDKLASILQEKLLPA
eukprot:jgi/Botrbrau1/13095/Bobra.0187s0054.1